MSPPSFTPPLSTPLLQPLGPPLTSDTHIKQVTKSQHPAEPLLPTLHKCRSAGEGGDRLAEGQPVLVVAG